MKYYFNIGYIRHQPFFQQFLSIAGYKEIKIQWVNINYSKKTMILLYIQTQRKILYHYLPRILEAWEDIEFYRNRLTVDIFQKPNITKVSWVKWWKNTRYT